MFSMSSAHDPSVHAGSGQETPSPANAPAGEPSGPVSFEPVPSTSAVPAVVRSTPAKREPLTPEQLAREVRRLDRALVVVALVFAFFLGSFAAHNSDYWMHLATG